MSALPLRKPNKAEQLRMNVAWAFRLALRGGMDEVIHGGIEPRRQSAVDALYECSPGYRDVEPLFAAAVQAAAAGQPAETVGQLFKAWVDAASANYVQITAECIEDPDWGKWVDYQEPVK